MRGTWGLLGAALAAVLALGACGADPAPEPTPLPRPSAGATGALTVWLMDGSQPTSLVDEVNARFAEDYPDVEVRVAYQQWSDVQQRLAAALPTDTAPDVVELGNNVTARYAEQGLLTDLSGEAERLDVAGMLPGLRETGAWQGRRYGVPYYGGTQVLVYRSDQLQAVGLEPPRTLDAVVEAAAALQRANGKPPEYSAFWFPGHAWPAAMPFVWAHGGGVAEQAEDGTWTGLLDSEGSRAGLAQLTALAREHSAAPADADASGNIEAFMDGRVGMMVDSWWVPGALDRDAMRGKVGVVAVPGLSAEASAPVPMGGSDLAVPARSTNPGLAVEWIRLLTGERAQQRLARSGVIPNQEAAFAGFEGNAALQVAGAAALGSRAMPVSPHWPDVLADGVLETMLEDLLTGRATVEDATTTASEAVAATLNR
jgi:N,N'-diacetylchitobiose transport system substrate-binding protein